jgi:hypothetical protein
MRIALKYKVNGKVTDNPFVSMANGINKRLEQKMPNLFGRVALDLWNDGKDEFLRDLEQRIQGNYASDVAQDMMDSVKIRVDHRAFGSVATIYTENKFLYAREYGINMHSGGREFTGLMVIPYERAMKNAALRDYIRKNVGRMKSYNTSAGGVEGEEDVVLSKVRITRAPFMEKILNKYSVKVYQHIEEQLPFHTRDIIRDGMNG